MPNRQLHWGVLYCCVYQGQTLPKLNFWSFKISPYQRYYLDCGSSLTQWARPVCGNHGNNLIRLIAESEYLLQSCLSEHLSLSRMISASVCVRHRTSATLKETIDINFCAVCPVGLFRSMLGRRPCVCLSCIKSPNTSTVYLRGFKIFCVNLFSHMMPQRCKYIKKINQTLATCTSSRELHLLKIFHVSAARPFNNFYLVSVCFFSMCIYCLSVYRDDFSYDGTMNHMMLTQK